MQLLGCRFKRINVYRVTDVTFRYASDVSSITIQLYLMYSPHACVVVVVNLYSHSECMQHVSRNRVRTGKQPKKHKIK